MGEIMWPIGKTIPIKPLALPWFSGPTEREIEAARPVLWVPWPSPNKKSDMYMEYKLLLKAIQKSDTAQNKVPYLIKEPGDTLNLSAKINCPKMLPNAVNINPKLARAIAFEDLGTMTSWK